MVSIDLFVLVKHPAVVFNLIIYMYIYMCILIHNENKLMQVPENLKTCCCLGHIPHSARI